MAFKLLVFLSCLVFAADSTGQTDRVTCEVNGDAILPVHLETTLDKSSLTIKWTHHGAPVHSFTSGKTVQGKDYTKRTSLFEEEITKGKVSLKLMKVTEKDAGEYTCTVDGENIEKREFTVVLEIRIHVSATIHGTVILPVHLRTKVDTASSSIRWKFGDKDVLSYAHGKSYVPDGNSKFKDRASFFEDKIPEGNISLKLRNIAKNETGQYTCVFQDVINKRKKIIVFLIEIDQDLIQAEKPSPVSPTNPSDSPGNSTDLGSIIGGVVGGLLVVAIVGGFFLWRKCKNSTRPAADAAQPADYAPAPVVDPDDAEGVTERRNRAEPNDQNRGENIELQDRGEQHANQ